MQLHPSPLRPAHSAVHLSSSIAHLASALIRKTHRPFVQSSSALDWKAICVAACVTLLTGGTSLSLTPTDKMIIPSSLIGGIHPASLEMLLEPAVKPAD